MRSIIRRLRPQPRDVPDTLHQPVVSQLQAFRRRIEDQWRVALELKVTPSVESLPAELRAQLLLIVQEAVLNAARHASAASIRASLDAEGQTAIAHITDDGKGFPFSGSYDLASLTALEIGPLTLKERVEELHGGLQIESSPSGSSVRITIPLHKTALASHAHLTRSR